jgi:CheY-like chemotaxis protein
MDAHLTKPFRDEELINLLRDFLPLGESLREERIWWAQT